MARRTNPSMRETYANVKQKASTLKSLTKQGVAAMKKHRDAEKKGLHHTVCNDCGAEDSAFVTVAGLRVPTDICTVCGGRGQAIVYRDNATFTLDQTYGSGHGDRRLVRAFYEVLNEQFPGNTPVPIPPESHVHPQHGLSQALIFADYAVRKIAPIALRAQGFAEHAYKLATCQRVDDDESAYAAAQVDYDAHDANPEHAITYISEIANAAAQYYDAHDATESYLSARNVCQEVGQLVANAAKLNPEATWDAVNEMLQAL